MAPPKVDGSAAVKVEVPPPPPVKAPEVKAPEAKPEEAAARPTGWQPLSFFVDVNPYIPYTSYATAGFGNDKYNDHTTHSTFDLTLRGAPNLFHNSPAHKLYTGPELRLKYQTVDTSIPAEFGPDDHSYANMFNFGAGWNLGGLHGSDTHAFEWRLAAGLGMTHISAEGKNATETTGNDGLRANNNIFSSDADVTGINLSAAAYLGYRYTDDRGFSLGFGPEFFVDNTWASFKPNYDTTTDHDADQGLGVPRMGVVAKLSVGFDFDTLFSGKPSKTAPPAEAAPLPEALRAPDAAKPAPAPEGITGAAKAVAEQASVVKALVATSVAKKHGENITTHLAAISASDKTQSSDRAQASVAEYTAAKGEYDAAAAKQTEAETALAALPESNPAEVKQKGLAKAEVEASKAEVEKLKGGVEESRTAALAVVKKFYAIKGLSKDQNTWSKETLKTLGAAPAAAPKAAVKKEIKATEGACPEGYAPSVTVGDGDKTVAVKCKEK